MIIKIRCRISSVVLFIIILSALVIFSCQSSPPSPPRETGSTEARPPSALPNAGLVEEIRGLTASGSLSSMLQALELIRSRNLGGTEFGRIMTGVNISLIKLVYPDSPARLPVADLPQTHSYARIIREAERGVYIRPPANSTDFFEYILPFLAINNQTGPVLPDVVRDLARAAELQPNSALPPFFQGIVHERAGRFAQAETAYRRAYGLSSECYPALIGAARMMSHAGNTAGAIALLSDLMIRYPDSTNIKRQIAIAHYESRNWERALSAVDEILLSEPRDGDFLLMKAHIHIEQGQYSQANAPLDIYASINSNNRTYLFYRARVQAEGNRNRDSALNYLRSILRTNSNDIEAASYAVTLLMESQRASDQEEGRQLLARLRQVSGNSVDVLNLSLQDAIRRENWREARTYLNGILAARRTPQDLASAYYVERGLGNNSTALAFARELYEKDTSNNDYAAIYVSALIDNGRRDEASRLIESRLNSSNASVKSQFYYLRSRIQSNEENALGDLRSSIFEDPRNLDALIAMFEIYHRRREERRAVYYLRQALAIAPDNPRLQRYEREYSALLERN